MADFSKIKKAYKENPLLFLKSLIKNGKTEGNNYVALNPRRNDTKTGSFKIDIASGKFYDFSSGDKGGSILDLAMFVWGCDLIEATQRLEELFPFLASNNSVFKGDSLAKEKEIGFQEKKSLDIEYIWSKSFVSDHPYLQKKKISIGNARVNYYKEKYNLVIPLVDIGKTANDFKLKGIQFIDEDGSKRFPSSFKGLFYIASKQEKSKEIIVITEGYATAQSIAECTDFYVISAMSSINMKTVALKISSVFPNSKLIIAADNDEAGEKATTEILKEIDAEIISPPQEFNDFNDMKQVVDAEIINNLFKIKLERRDIEREVTMEKMNQNNKLDHEFYINDNGLFYNNNYICDYIETIAFVRDHEDNNWKRRIKFKNLGNRFHTMDIGIEQSIDTKDFWKILGKAGFEISEPKHQKLVLKYLRSMKPNTYITNVSKIGWINDYLFASPSFQLTSKETDELFSIDSKIKDNGFNIEGNLKDWQDNICKYCENNDILTLALCSAFAGPLLKFVNQTCTVANLVGKSSIGKTTALNVASSVWGNPRQFITQWRVTSNALESVAEQHNSCLLVLDELSQVNKKEIGDTIYTLGNGKGKVRSTREATLKEIKEWNVSILSSGEVGIVDILSNNQEDVKAGQLVRFVDIDSEISGGYGIYNELHGFKDGAILSNTLKENCAKYHGIASKIFIEEILKIEPWKTLEYSIKKEYNTTKQDIYNKFELHNANGQVKRVADVFALYQLAGKLAKEFKIIMFDVTDSIYNLFGCWLVERGNKTESFEEKDILDNVTSFLIQHESRFATYNSDGQSLEKSVIDKTIHNCLGGREERDGYIIYYIIPSLFNKEICGGNSKLYKKVLIKEGILIAYESEGAKRKLEARRYTLDGKRIRMTTLVFKKEKIDHFFSGQCGQSGQP